jgi:hypothetical protein
MKIVRQLLVLSISMIFLASCSETKQSNIPVQNQNMSGNMQQQAPIQTNSFQQNKQPKQTKLEMKYFRDSTGAKSFRMPLPANLKVNPNYKDSLKISGPNGIMVAEMDPMNFAYSENSSLQKDLYNEGFEWYAYPTIEELAPNFLKPMKTNGFIELNQYPLPAYTERMQKSLNRLKIPGGTVKAFARVFELKGPKNEDAVILMAQSKISVNGVDFWSVNISVLKTPTADFKMARDTYLFALNNIEVNPKIVDDTNQEIKSELQQNNAN